ncbi:WYL domain-containing protein [Crocinitomicaceae bacterium]|nr:WYL domain-containing protein [Crocinitomicaceae bacterium]
MPHIKNALIRYRIIDRALRNNYRPFPSKRDIRELCEEALFGSIDGENICDSTIEKDLFAMRMEHDAPIKYNKREGGYFYTEPDFSINDIPLTNDDIESIKFAVNTLSQFREVDMFKQFGNAIDKIVDRFTIAQDPRDKEIANFVQFETSLSSIGNEYLAPLLEAIKNNYITTFDYTSFITSKKKERQVVPLLLKEYRNRWYLLSFDLSKSQIITYALERIENLIVSEEIGEKPLSFDPERFFKHAVGITSSEEDPVKVILKTDKVSARYINSQPFHTSQNIIKEGKNKTTFELNVLISEEFIRSILSYGGGIEVAEPVELRDEIIFRLEEMAENYKI